LRRAFASACDGGFLSATLIPMQPLDDQAFNNLDNAAAEAIVADAFKDLATELSRRPITGGVSVAVEVGGKPSYYLLCGQLVHAGDEGCDSQAAAQTCDVVVSFHSTQALAGIISRVRPALQHNDLLSILYEFALPKWGAPKAMEVSGAATFARLIWSAWLASEQNKDEDDKARQFWANDDLSQGWVMVHSVSPGIRDRVAMFQQELKSVQGTGHTGAVVDGCSESTKTQTSWMDELVHGLCQSAALFQNDESASAEADSVTPTCERPSRYDHLVKHPPSVACAAATVPAMPKVPPAGDPGTHRKAAPPASVAEFL